VAHKHQIWSGRKSTRTAAGRKWRRVEKQHLHSGPKHKSYRRRAPRSQLPKNPVRRVYITKAAINTISIPPELEIKITDGNGARGTGQETENGS
jgi:hypothetical protein